MSECWYERVMVRRDGMTRCIDILLVGSEALRQHRRDIFCSSVIALSRDHIGDLSPQPLPSHKPFVLVSANPRSGSITRLESDQNPAGSS